MSPERSRILTAAARYAREFHRDNLTAAPTRRIAVVACMDARLDLFRLLGLEVGDAHILRNAGGRVTEDILRSLTLSTNLLGTREIVVIHHTGCGLYRTTNDRIADRVEEVSGTRPELDFHAFDDLEASVRSDVAAVGACATLPADLTVWGAFYDVTSGELIPVEG